MTDCSRSLSVSNRHPRLRLDRAGVVRVIAELDRSRALFRGGCPAGELSVAFMTDTQLAALHAAYLDDPSETDVITFEGDPSLGVAGEICVSADAAMRQSARPSGFARELTLYLAHGWLHLAGYDDLKPALKRTMRRAEARALARIEGAAGLPRFQLLKPKERKRWL